jgi:ADP-ribose pyrophosphatase
MGQMKWKLIDVKQETDHPFLNFFTITYDVEKDDGHHKYSYFMASRKNKDKLVCQTKNLNSPDGVLIPLYCHNKEGKLCLLITSQFRPPLNTYVHSFPAGLIDEGEDILKAAKREAREEVGADIIHEEILAPASPTSSGMSDEMNGVVLAEIVGFENREEEEFEDIDYELIPFEKLEEYTQNHFFALQIRMIIKYILEKFKGQY